MKKAVAIYLAGSIQKGHEKGNELYWTDAHMAQIQSALASFDLSFLNPAFRTDDLSDSRSIFGRDILQVFSSDAVFVDARDRRGLGVGAEMMWAKMNGIPVVTWAPLETHYHRSWAELLGVEITDYIHPFVASLSDQIVETVEEGASWIEKVLADPLIPIKTADSIRKAMVYYKETQYSADHPMQEMAEKNQRLSQRIKEASH